MKLINSNTKEDLKIGDKVTTFRGEEGILEAYQEPRNSGSVGRVYVRIDNLAIYSFFPSVIDAQFIED